MIVFLILSVLAGCQNPPALRGDIHQHVIAMDSDGVARDPAKFAAGPIAPEVFAQQVKVILDAMDEFHSRPQFAGKPKKIMIFVHGGLNTPDSALDAANSEVGAILDAGYFPIFINWQSDLFDSYGEHLTCVTQGRKLYDKPLGRVLLSPLYLFADVGRAVTRAPLVWANQVSSDSAAASADVHALMQKRMEARNSALPYHDRWSHSVDADNTAAIFSQLYDLYKNDHPGSEGPHKQIQISIRPDNDVNPGHLAELAAWYTVTLPTKFGTSWIIDGLGKSAWDNMSRRTFTIFEGRAATDPQSPSVRPEDVVSGGATEEEQPVNSKRLRLKFSTQRNLATTQQTVAEAAPPPPDFDQQGALDYFKNYLADRIQRHAPVSAWEQYEITLVGHSMGSMVLNEWVRRNDEDGLFYKNIVYLAAACSVRDFNRSIVPYLRTHKNEHDVKFTTAFYNLTLHPTAELRERNRPVVGDLPARGSLLVWIDDFLSDPATPLDRTLGRWENIVQAAHVIPPTVKGQVTIKAMSLDPSDQCDGPHRAPDPQSHGQFRCFHYWDAKLWRADLPSDYQDHVSDRTKIELTKRRPPRKPASQPATEPAR